MGGYQLTAIIEREGGLFVARCVELDIVVQGPTGATTFSKLKETVTFFLDNAGDSEILERLSRDVEVKLFEVERQ